MYINKTDNMEDLMTKTESETQEFPNIFLIRTFRKGTKNIVVTLIKRKHRDEIRLIQE